MRFSSSILFIGIIISTIQMSCQKGTGESGTTDTLVTQLDVKRVLYGSDTAQNMDIYLPAGRDTSKTKVLLFIHGGSWSSGDKTEFDEAIAAIRGQLPDYAIFNMNYRLVASNRNQYPTQLNDLQAALDFVTGKASEYKINANKICLIGASAGAHLALLHAYKNNSAGKIKALIDLFGPTDLTDLYKNHPIPAASRPVLVNFLGATQTANPTLYQQASPVNFVSAQSVPTKIFHGSADIVVPIAQSNNLKAALEANKVKVEMTAYANEGHSWLGPNLLDTYAQSVKFIKENVF